MNFIVINGGAQKMPMATALPQRADSTRANQHDVRRVLHSFYGLSQSVTEIARRERAGNNAVEALIRDHSRPVDNPALAQRRRAA